MNERSEATATATATTSVRHRWIGGPLAGALWCVLSLACGDDGGAGGPDAGTDASVAADAPTTDAATGDRSCSVQTGAPGITAVLHGADGAVHTVGTTDATGLAAWPMCPSGAMVSFAGLDADDEYQGVTIAGVEPGDHHDVRIERLGIVTTAAVAVPVDNADVMQIRAHGGGRCSIGSVEGGNAQFPISATCIGDDPTKLSALATGTIGGVNVYAYATDAPIVSPGTTTLASLTGWMTGQSVTASATNVTTAQVNFTVQPLRNGVPYSGLIQLTNAAGSTASQVLPMPPSGFTTTKRVGVATNGLASQGLVRMTTEATASFDLAALLPAITNLSVDNATPARPIFAIAGGGSATDLAIVRARWTRNATEVHWRLIFPTATTGLITFPVLPTELAGAVPIAARATTVVAIEISGSTYAQILARGYWSDVFLDSCATLPAAATCAFTSLQIP